MKLSRTSVGLALRTARLTLDLTATELAELTGISASSISRTEAGLRVLEFPEALLVVKALGIDLSTLQDLAETFEREGVHEKSGQINDLRQDLIGLQRQALTMAISYSKDRPKD